MQLMINDIFMKHIYMDAIASTPLPKIYSLYAFMLATPAIILLIFCIVSIVLEHRKSKENKDITGSNQNTENISLEEGEKQDENDY